MAITKSLYGTLNGKDVNAYIIENKNGTRAHLIEKGATLDKLFVKNNEGELIDVLVGHDTLDGHVNRSDYQGVVVGQYANRIKDGKFSIDGVEYNVTLNEKGITSLHGGGEYSSAVWSTEILSENAVKFTYFSPDGTEGFPGNVQVSVTYTLSDNDELELLYNAVSDKKTVINLTNHAYFNLNGTCMMLENCVYDFFELTCLNMAQQGLFGEILHAEGAYIHNLSDFWDDYHNNWRLDFNQKHRGDVYATHGFGPVCMALNIHRGNRLTHLVAMDTKSVLGLEKAKAKMGVTEFANGDHTNTLIQTALGQTIELQHNVYTPRPYNRLYQLTGTKGFANKYPIDGFTFMPGQLPEDILPEGTKLLPSFHRPSQNVG